MDVVERSRDAARDSFNSDFQIVTGGGIQALWEEVKIVGKMIIELRPAPEVKDKETGSDLLG